MFNEWLMKLIDDEPKTLLFLCYSTIVKRIWVVVFLCFYSFIAIAQKGFSIEPTLHIGVVTKHSPELTFDVKEPSIGADISFKFQTFGKREWEEWRKFPKVGITEMWMRFGNETILGHAFAISPNISLPLFDLKKWTGLFQTTEMWARTIRPFPTEVTTSTTPCLGRQIQN